MTWTPGKYFIAMPYGPSEVDGHIYRGLGIKVTVKSSPKGRRPAIWTVTHVGTGHAVARLCGSSVEVVAVATEIAECGDWSFDSLSGWKNVDPEIGHKTRAILARHNQEKFQGLGGGNHEGVASEIARSRVA